MRSLTTQLNIMLHKRGFQLSFTVMLLFIAYSLAAGLLQRSQWCIYDTYGLQAVHNSFLNDFSEERFKIFEYLFPFIVVLPFSFSLYVDRSTRISEAVITRCGKRSYYFSKLTAAFIGGGLIIFIPLLISTALTHGFYTNSVINPIDPNYSLMTAGGKDFLTMRDLLLEITLVSPVLGELFASLLLSVYAGACAALALSLSSFIRRFSILIFLPVFLLTKLFDLFQSMIKVSFGYTFFHADPMKYVIISTDSPFYGRPYWLFAAVIAVMLALSAVIMLLASRRDSL